MSSLRRESAYLNVEIEQGSGDVKGRVDLQVEPEDEIVDRWKLVMEILRC